MEFLNHFKVEYEERYLFEWYEQYELCDAVGIVLFSFLLTINIASLQDAFQNMDQIINVVLFVSCVLFLIGVFGFERWN